MKKSQVENNLIKDEEKKYFFITPRLVGALTTSPFESSLWGTIKDICGESGECFISTPDLALLSNMSDGSVSTHRIGLIEKGLLKGEIKKDSGFPQPVWHLSIPDLWEANINFVMANPTISDRVEFKRAQKESLQEMKAKELSGDERGTPTDERGTPTDETKNKRKNKQKEKQPGVKVERFNTYLSAINKKGNPKSEYVLRSEALEVWFIRCRLGTPNSKPVPELVKFLPDWEKGGAGLMKTWRVPLNTIYQKCDQDFELTKLVIQEALKKLQGLTISQPIQILKTAESLIFDLKIANELAEEDDQPESVPQFPEMIDAERLAALQDGHHE